MQWKIVYYNESVEQEVFCLEKTVRAKYIAILDMMIAHGPNLGLPHTKAMGDGLFEVRAKGQSGIARGLFCTISNKTIVILNVFVKKTRITPKKEWDLAKQRMREVMSHDL